MSGSIANRKDKDSNIELLRILAGIGVIVLHLNNPADGAIFDFAKMGGCLTEYIVTFFECLSICSVDVFLIVTGYYLCKTNKRKLSKVLFLLIQCVVFAEIKYLGLSLLHSEKVVMREVLLRLIPNNYYITRYSVLYFISPLINYCFMNNTQRKARGAVWGLLVIVSLIPTIVGFVQEFFSLNISDLNPVGGNVGYTITNFIMMYIVGLALREYRRSISTKWILLTSVVSVVSVFFWEISYMKHTGWIYGSALTYNNPFVILMAVSFFMLFDKLNITGKASVIINEFAKAGLTVYLFHGFFVMALPLERIMQSKYWGIILALACIGTYIGCYLAYKIWHLFTHRAFRYIEHKMRPFDVFDLS